VVWAFAFLHRLPYTLRRKGAKRCSRSKSLAGVAESADATVSKTVGDLPPCEFDPRLRHRLVAKKCGQTSDRREAAFETALSSHAALPASDYPPISA
jgi:hypothetical protein